MRFLATQDIAREATGLADRVADFLPRLGWVLVAAAVGYGLAALVRVSLRALLRRRHPPSFSRVMSRIAGWGVLTTFVVLGVTVAFPSVKPVDVLAGLGFFSVAVGYAFRDILENALAGVLLLFRQPFQAGDEVLVDKIHGTIKGITIRETQIVTFDGVLVLVPNRDVYKSSLHVYTYNNKRRYTVTVGIAYEADPQLAASVMTRTVEELPHVLDSPAPRTTVSALGTSTVDLRADFWGNAHQSPGRQLHSDVTVAIKRALEEHGIEMPADIIAVQATPSLKAALQPADGSAGVTDSTDSFEPSDASPRN